MFVRSKSVLPRKLFEPRGEDGESQNHKSLYVYGSKVEFDSSKVAMLSEDIKSTSGSSTYIEEDEDDFDLSFPKSMIGPRTDLFDLYADGALNNKSIRNSAIFAIDYAYHSSGLRKVGNKTQSMSDCHIAEKADSNGALDMSRCIIPFKSLEHPYRCGREVSLADLTASFNLCKAAWEHAINHSRYFSYLHQVHYTTPHTGYVKCLLNLGFTTGNNSIDLSSGIRCMAYKNHSEAMKFHEWLVAMFLKGNSKIALDINKCTDVYSYDDYKKFLVSLDLLREFYLRSTGQFTFVLGDNTIVDPSGQINGVSLNSLGDIELHSKFLIDQAKSTIIINEYKHRKALNNDGHDDISVDDYEHYSDSVRGIIVRCVRSHRILKLDIFANRPKLAIPVSEYDESVEKVIMSVSHNVNDVD